MVPIKGQLNPFQVSVVATAINALLSDRRIIGHLPIVGRDEHGGMSGHEWSREADGRAGAGRQGFVY